jgi:hypothetical protein
MEVRFAEPTSITEFKAHCIKNDGQTQVCYANGDYDFTALDVQYWDNGWVTAHSLTQRHSGDYEASITNAPLATNWRFFFHANQHPNGDGATHMAEMEIIQACVA